MSMTNFYSPKVRQSYWERRLDFLRLVGLEKVEEMLILPQMFG